MSEAGRGPDDNTMREDATMVFRLPTDTRVAARTNDPVHFLHLLEGEPPFKRIPLEHPPLTVGRQEPANIVLAGGTVSRRHCRFSRDGDRMLLEDLGSTNGTLVNSKPLSTPVALLDGDVISIGAYQLRYHRRSAELDAEADAMEGELRDAAAYVESILPPPITSGPVLAEWFYRPSTQLAGDAFGYQMLDDQHFMAFVLDVSGHGIGPALYSVSVANVLRQHLLPGADFRDPSAVVTALNNMFPMEQHNGLFFTIWYGVYNVPTRTLSFASGGHHPAYLVLPGATQAMPVGTRNPAVGFTEGRVFKAASAPVLPGSALHLFSDGVFEIVDDDGQHWNIDTLSDLLPEVSGEGGPRTLYDRVRSVARGGRLDDDFSSILLRFP
ncbi:MAG: SpoIIE family protein phosphatase [Acetobacteraceae bacterium]|nr:SpoIIE family protein phosphatase [Pseudomonadota bacterium]